VCGAPKYIRLYFIAITTWIKYTDTAESFKGSINQMSEFPDWQYNEFKQVGTDYSEYDNTEAYDGLIKQVENAEKENENIVSKISLNKGQSLIDLGAGTGTFTIYAARQCNLVYAVDVSNEMLDVARQKAQQQGLTNIHFHTGSFLTYVHIGEPADAIVSKLALHHLPDFWKSIALYRISNMLKVGGKFYLEDVVFSFDPINYQAFFDQLIQNAPTRLVNEIKTHIREEYSTFYWIMEELLTRAGFVVDDVDYRNGFIAHYLCSKRKLSDDAFD